MGYAGGMIGPPVIGSLGHEISLRGSLLILLALMVVLVILSPKALGGAKPGSQAVTDEALVRGTASPEA
jgi:hypothetical protein